MSVIDNPLYHRALALLARRDYSQKELAERLARHEESHPELIEQILQRLVELGYQNDARFAKSYVRYRVGRGFGPERLVRELRERGIASTEIDEALQYQEEECPWATVAAQVWRKKFKNKYQNFPEKVKQHNFLRYRGFTDEHILGVFSAFD